MESDLSSGDNDCLDDLESQEVDASSEVSVCLLVLSFYLAIFVAACHTHPHQEQISSCF